MTTTTVLTQEERTCLPELFEVFLKVPESYRQYFLGYGQAIVDNGIGKNNSNMDHS